MFEKEAKEQANKKYPIPLNWNEIDTISRSKYEEGYHDGAKFGYNKANEWQYVSEKGIPKVNGDYHVWLGKCNYEVTYFDGNRLWVVSEDPVDSWIDPKDVIAWKEIVLPKEGE